MPEAPKVTIVSAETQVPSPTQLAMMPKTASYVDARGRRITVMPLNALEHYRLTQFGAKSDNPATANYEIMAASVCGIDAEQIARPTSKLQLEAMIQRLDFDGLEAVGEALKLIQPPSIDAAKN